jgi:hypothetical protein
VPIMGISSGLLLGDFLGEEEAENCLSSSTVNAPKIGLSSWLLHEFDPGDMLFSRVMVVLGPIVLLLLTGGVSDETNQLDKLVSTAISCIDFLV